MIRFIIAPHYFVHPFSIFYRGLIMQDLSNYSLAKLRALEVQVIDELKTRHFLSVSKAREQILHIAQSAGISVKDLMAGKSAPRAKTAPSAAKFRNPNDSSQEWSGRGRQPNWVKAWTASGKSLDDAKI
jgi:DNA-binding protein H-NS